MNCGLAPLFGRARGTPETSGRQAILRSDLVATAFTVDSTLR